MPISRSIPRIKDLVRAHPLRRGAPSWPCAVESFDSLPAGGRPTPRSIASDIRATLSEAETPLRSLGAPWWRLSDNAILCHRRGPAPASRWIEESAAPRGPRAVSRLISAPLRSGARRSRGGRLPARIARQGKQASAAPFSRSARWGGGPRRQGPARARKCRP